MATESTRAEPKYIPRVPRYERRWFAVLVAAVSLMLLIFWGLSEVGLLAPDPLLKPWRTREGIVNRHIERTALAVQPAAPDSCEAENEPRNDEGRDCAEFCDEHACNIENVICESFSPNLKSVRSIHATSVIFEQPVWLDGAELHHVEFENSVFMQGLTFQSGVVRTFGLTTAAVCGGVTLDKSKIASVALEDVRLLGHDKDSTASLSLEQGEIGRFSAERILAESRVSFEQTKFGQIDIVSSDFLTDFNAENAEVAGDLNLHDGAERSSEVMLPGSGDGEQRWGCPTNEFPPNAQPVARSRVRGDLRLRGLKASSVGLTGTTVGEADLDAVELTGPLELRFAKFGSLHATSLRARDIDAFGLVASSIVSNSADIAFNANFQCSHVTKVYLEWLKAGGSLSFEHARIDALDLYHLGVARFAFGGSELQSLHLGGSALTSADATGALVRMLDFGVTTIGTFNLEGLEGTWKSDNLTVARYADPQEVTLAALHDQVKRVRDAAPAEEVRAREVGAREEVLRQQYATVQKLLRDTGRAREANLVQLAQSRVLWNTVELPSLLVLRGLGHPGWYVVLMLLLTAVGVATAFRRTDPEELPPGVSRIASEAKGDRVLLLLLARRRRSDHRAALGVASTFRRTKPGEPPPGASQIASEATDHRVGESSDAPAYSAWIMSIATLLPGDVLGYLRNYVYRPSTTLGAIGITVFQLLGLFVQVLLVFSVLSLVR